MKLVHALLVAMVGAPYASLTQRELSRRFQEEFEDARRDHLIEELSGPVEYVANDEGQRRRVVVEEAGAALIDENDPEEDPERWPLEDVRRWRVAAPQVIDALRSRNGLSSDFGIVDSGCWLLGDAESRRVVLVFAGNLEIREAAEHAQETVAPGHALVVVTPNVAVSLAMAVALKKRRITFARLTDHLAIAPPLRGLDAGAKQIAPISSDAWTLSADFRSARTWDDQIDLTPKQASAVEVFHRQLLQGDEELSQHYVLAQAEIGSKTLYQLFRRSRAWGQLVVPGSAKGMFRLNIVSPLIHR